MHEFLRHYDSLFKPFMGARALTFRRVLERVLEKNKPINIVETGSIREVGNWGDGQSTIIFDDLIRYTGGTFFSVDISFKCIKVAERAGLRQTHLIIGDSVNFLHSFELDIDLLYLDSLDYYEDNPQPAIKQQMFELCAAWPKLKRGSIVFCDDTTYEKGHWQGKGNLTSQFFRVLKIQPLVVGHWQTAWELTSSPSTPKDAPPL